MQPQIIVQEVQGFHNSKPHDQLIRGNTYQDLSTVCVMPTRGVIGVKVALSWLNLMSPMNQKFMRMPVIGMEVGQAYSTAIENILAHPELSKWKYVLTLEEDNIPPPDGLLKLLETIQNGDYGAVGSLYWTKGEVGKPMCYGRPGEFPLNFIPFLPEQLPGDGIVRCNGLGMGFTLFKLDMFRDAKLQKPFFQTVQRYEPGVGISAYTQDLKFFEKANALGYRFACDTRVKVGHYDISNDYVW